MAVEKEGRILQFRMLRSPPKCFEPLIKQAPRPETTLHGVPIKLEQRQVQLSRDLPQLSMLVQRLSAAMAGHDHDAPGLCHAIRNPQVKLHVLPFAFALFFHRLLPLLISEFPVPAPLHRLLRRRRSPLRFIQHTIPVLLALHLRIGPHPADAVAFGQLQSFGEFNVSGVEICQQQCSDEKERLHEMGVCD